MAIGGPSKLSTILIQRLDTMLGTKIGQQGVVSRGAEPHTVFQAGSTDNLMGLKNPAEQELIDDLARQTKHSKQAKTTDKALHQLGLNNVSSQRNTNTTVTKSAPTTLGHTARIILALLNKYPQSDHNIRAQRPLLSGEELKKAGKSRQLNSSLDLLTNNKFRVQTAGALQHNSMLSSLFARNLAQSIQNSGLFYESFLNRLAKSEIDINVLKNQPQAKFANELQNKNYTNNRNLAENLNSLLQNNDKQTETNAPRSAFSNADTLQSQNTSISDQLQNIVRQQLEVLANQSLVWKGEAWPGVEMECELIRHEESEEHSSNTDSQDQHERPDQWSGNINLKLPALGHIKANIQLQGDKINIYITAPESAAQLQLAQDDLFHKLLNTGLKPQQLLIGSTAQEDNRNG